MELQAGALTCEGFVGSKQGQCSELKVAVCWVAGEKLEMIKRTDVEGSVRHLEGKSPCL